MIVCPQCYTENVLAATHCIQCGTLLPLAGQTTPISGEPSSSTAFSAGEATLTDNEVILGIDDKRLPLPDRVVVTLGRRATAPGVAEPDIPLNAFNADSRGVSRIHCKIQRRGTLLFISDLGSTNGTYLNGRRLVAFEERVLRDGDEVYLSHLRFVVLF